MIDEVLALEMPEWLSEILKNPKDGAFQIENILRDSLYYPGSFVDATPVNYLVGNIFSFVYADNRISIEELLNYLDRTEIYDEGFINYHSIIEKNMKLSDIAPGGWPPGVVRRRIDFLEFYDKDILDVKPDCHWSVWKRNEGLGGDIGPEGFSFFYAFAEMSELYESLYNGLSIAPKILAIITGGLANNPESNDSDFKRVVVSNPNGLPDYLLNGHFGGPGPVEACWREYQGKRIVQLPKRDAGLWKLNL